MSNVIVRKSSDSPTVSQLFERDPLRVMRDLFRWDPFREMSPLAPEAPAFAPAFEVKETKEGYVFKADIPGVKESDLQVTLTGNRLSISGKRESEKEDDAHTYYTYERSYGSFSRAFTLPEGIDGENIKAEIAGGVLTLVVPKRPESQPRTIAIKPAGVKS